LLLVLLVGLLVLFGQCCWQSQKSQRMCLARLKYMCS